MNEAGALWLATARTAGQQLPDRLLPVPGCRGVGIVSETFDRAVLDVTPCGQPCLKGDQHAVPRKRPYVDEATAKGISREAAEDKVVDWFPPSYQSSIRRPRGLDHPIILLERRPGREEGRRHSARQRVVLGDTKVQVPSLSVRPRTGVTSERGRGRNGLLCPRCRGECDRGKQGERGKGARRVPSQKDDLVRGRTNAIPGMAMTTGERLKRFSQRARSSMSV